MPDLIPARARAARRLGLGRESRDINGQSWQGFALNAPVLSGVLVTPQTALTLTAVYCAINIIASDVANLPRYLYRRQKSGGKVIDTSKEVNDLVHFAPNGEMPAFFHYQAAMGHVLGWGNSYSEIKRDYGGNPTGLYLLHPGTTKPKRTEKSKALYYEDEATGKTFAPENILHIRGLGFDGLKGYSPVTLARQAVGLGIAAEEFGAALFGNGAIPKGLLKTPKRLTETAAKNLRESFERVHQGTKGAHRVAVLEEGADWVDTQINPDDAQFLATRQFQVLEVCRIFNLPPHKLADYSKTNYSTVEQANIAYLTNTLSIWLAAIEAESNFKLLTAKDRKKWVVEHDVSRLLRAAIDTRIRYFESRYRMGSITPNEIRLKEGENPFPPELGGDRPMVQAQMVPLEQAEQATDETVKPVEVDANADVDAGPVDPATLPKDPPDDQVEVEDDEPEPKPKKRRGRRYPRTLED